MCVNPFDDNSSNSLALPPSTALLKTAQACRSAVKADPNLFVSAPKQKFDQQALIKNYEWQWQRQLNTRPSRSRFSGLRKDETMNSSLWFCFPGTWRLSRCWRGWWRWPRCARQSPWSTCWTASTPQKRCEAGIRHLLWLKDVTIQMYSCKIKLPWNCNNSHGH